MMRIAGIALLIGGMAVSIGATSDARDARVLASRGVETSAIVTDVSIESIGRSSHAEADVDYEDEFGITVSEADIVYCGDEDAIAVGDEVEITYDPEEEAPAQFTECPQSQEITIPLVIGIAAIAAGTFFILRSWAARGWRRRWVGIPLLVLGLAFVGASFEDDCGCQELVYTGGAMVVIGLVPLVAPRDKVVYTGQGPPDGQGPPQGPPDGMGPHGAS